MAPGRASVIAYATSIWVIPLSALVLKGRLSAAQWLAAALSYAGIGVIVAPAFSLGRHTVIGLVMLLGASFAWACNIIQLRGNRHVRLGADMIPWQTGIATVPLAALACLRDGAPAFLAVPDAWPVIFYTGPLATALTFIVVLGMTQKLPPVAVHRHAVRAGDWPGRVLAGIPRAHLRRSGPGPGTHRAQRGGLGGGVAAGSARWRCARHEGRARRWRRAIVEPGDSEFESESTAWHCIVSRRVNWAIGCVRSRTMRSQAPRRRIPADIAQALQTLRCIEADDDGRWRITDKGLLALRMEEPGAIHLR